jgi:hypothetical protein
LVTLVQMVTAGLQLLHMLVVEAEALAELAESSQT